MPDGDKKRFHGLTAQGPSGPICDRARNHQRKFLSGLLENFCDGEERRLRVERVEDCFNNQKIDTSFDERAYLVEVSLAQLIERHRAKAWIIYIRRDGRGDGKGTDRSGDETGTSRLLCRAIRGAARDRCGGHVHLVHQRAKIDIVHHALEKLSILASICRLFAKEKIVQADCGGTKRICFDDVGAGFEILGMNLLDDFRSGQQ